LIIQLGRRLSIARRRIAKRDGRTRVLTRARACASEWNFRASRGIRKRAIGRVKLDRKTWPGRIGRVLRTVVNGARLTVTNRPRRRRSLSVLFRVERLGGGGTRTAVPPTHVSAIRVRVPRKWLGPVRHANIRLKADTRRNCA